MIIYIDNVICKVYKCFDIMFYQLPFQRIANITTTLQYSLEGSFKEGLEQGEIHILRQCLRTYATIDKMRDAENLFRLHIVKPYMEEVPFYTNSILLNSEIN